MTDPETIASLRRALANATGRATDAANQRDHYRGACVQALTLLQHDPDPAECRFRAETFLRGALAGDSPDPALELHDIPPESEIWRRTVETFGPSDPWTYVTDDDASLPPVGERVLLWKGDQITPLGIGSWDGKYFDDDDWDRPVPRPYVKAWMRVQPPKTKETHNAL